MIAYFCIVISLFIPLACTFYAKLSKKGYSNSKPREFLEGLDGKAKRAHYAQNNFYETFPAFAVGVVAAHQLNADPTSIDKLAVTYVVMRILYVFFYISDKSTLRSTVWFIAFIAILGLYFVK